VSLADRLPRGPHHLSRDEVVASQRSRVFRAMAEVMAEKGYAATTVSEVLRRARVSRETFYEQFSSKEDCFMGAFAAAVDAVLAGAFEALPADGTPLERFDHALRAYLDALASHPALARLLLVEVYAAGPDALARRAELQQRFAEALDATFGAATPGDHFANEALVAATGAMVSARLSARDPEAVRALHGPLLDLARRLHGGGR
jgi:AcrR family transcriptional regulator